MDDDSGFDAGAAFDARVDADAEVIADSGYDLDLCIPTESDASAAAPALATRCADRRCEVIGACCLAAGQCCATQASPEEAFPRCDPDPVDCFTASQVKVVGDGPGEVRPELGWLPLAADDDVAALRWAVPLSTRLATTVSVRLQLPAATPACAADCAQELGFGLTLASATAWEPSISVRLSAERSQAVLMLKGIPIATHAIDAERQEMSLVLEPGGRLDWLVGERSIASARPPFAGQPVDLVVFGNTDPNAESPAHIEGVSVTARACDTPTAWGTREPFFGAASQDAFEHPSQIVAQDEEWYAMDGPRGIHLWRGGSANAKPTDKDLGAPALTPEQDTFYADAVGHPELALEDGALVVYFAGTTQDTTSIGRAVVDRATATLGQVENVLDATKLGVDTITEPSVLEFRGDRLMAARVVAGADDSLVLFTHDSTGTEEEDGGSLDADANVDVDAGADSDADADADADAGAGSDTGTPAPSWRRYAWRGGTLDGARLRVTGGSAKATDPELATSSEALLLYFTVQDLSGDRIAAVASQDADTWLDLGPQLQPGTSIGQLGVSSCDVAAVRDEVRMLFTATDGTVPQPAQTARSRVSE